MFELNNLGVYVASPLQLWLNHLDGLEAGTPQQQQQAADAYITAGGGGGRTALARLPPCSLACSLYRMWLPAPSDPTAHTERTATAAPRTTPRTRTRTTSAGRFIEALPEELPGCDGNAFYALHRCVGAGGG